MIPDGFFGTRADLIIDVVVVMFALWPFILFAIIWLAANGKFQAHRNFHFVVFACAFLLVLALEIDLRFSDLLIEIKQTPMYSSTWAKTIFAIHLVVALFTFISWVSLLIRSSKRFKKQLPGEFSQQHKFWGKLIVTGLVLTSITGIALYIVVFVMTALN